MAPKNFNEATAVLSAINYIWALRIYQQPKHKVRYFINLVYCVSIFSMTSGIIVFTEFVRLRDFPTRIELNVFPFDKENTMYMHFIALYVILLTWMVVMGLYQSKDSLEFKKHVSKIDEEFEKLGFPFNYRSMFIRVLTSGSVWFFSSFIFTGMYLKIILKNKTGILVPLAIFSYLYESNIGSIILFDFGTSVFWLGVRFKQTNELLCSIFVKDHRIERINSISKSNQNHRFQYFSSRSKIFPKSRTSDFKYVPRSNKMMFQRIRLLHLELCCIAKKLSKLFDSQLLLYAVHSLLHFAINLYYIYMEIRNSIDSYKLKLNLTTILIMERIVNFIKLSIVSYNCEQTMKQACKMVEIVHEFSVYETDVELNEEILQFILQLSHTKLGKSKFNFFRVNFSFLRECLSFVVKYLVIVLQFNFSPDTFDDSVTQNSTIY